MNNNRKLVGCGLIAAIILSLLPYPSLGNKSRQLPTGPQQEGVVVSQLVQNRAPDAELSKHFRKYDLLRMDPVAVSSQIQKTGRVVLRSSVRDFDLRLFRHDLRSADYSAQVIDSNGVAHPLPKGEVQTYKGYVKGLPDAQARMSLTSRGIEGAIFTTEGRYFLQPAQSISKGARADEFVLYEGADLHEHDGTCGVTLADEVAARQEMGKVGVTEVIEAEASGPVPSISPMKTVRISTDADGEYVTSFGGASQANNQINSILNFVEGIYESEMGLTFQIVQQNTWANPGTDPYTTTVPSQRLGQFRDHWNANFPNSGGNARSIAHLFTGVDLDGGTIGIASFGVACRNANFSYGLSQQFPVGSSTITAQTVVLTAHEIGHNFGASHTNQLDTQVPPDIEPACEETIMEASVGNGSSFCQFSRSQIAGHASGHSSCLIDTATPPPTSQDCTTTPITAGVPVNGNLAGGDCRSPSRGVEHFADRYAFNGNAGERVSITLNSGNMDPYLYLIAPDGYFVSQDDDGNGGLNSRIPLGAGNVTLPQTGTYIIEATSFGPQVTGSYTVTVNATSCFISAAPGAFHFPAAGGSASLAVTVSGTCDQYFVAPDQRTNGSSFITVAPPQADFVSRTFNFTVSPNGNAAGRRSHLIIGAAGGGADVGGLRIPITQSGSSPDCTPTQIAFGQTLNGNLQGGDCRSPIRGSDFAADRYAFNASAGQKVAILTNAPVGNPDTFLLLIGPNGVVLLTDDDSGGGTSSRIPGGNRSLTLGLSGTYTIEVTGFSSVDLGAYSVTLNADPAPANTIQFTQVSHNINESPGGSLSVAVNRSGDTSGPATVDYASSDTSGSNTCNTTNGAASSRCDYLRTLGRLRFAAGETSKTIAIPVVNDVYAEGAETFSLALTNPIGATLGGPSSTTVTITDDDVSNGVNPIDNATFFVRQHYIDFLNREPDTAGLNFWVNEITSCGSNASCIEVRRINVSAAFFISIEFQETGYLVYRTYKTAFGNLPGAPVPVVLNDFLRDTQGIGQGVQVNVGNWRAVLEANKKAYMEAFVQRSDFLAAFPNTMSATDFVNQLNTRAGGVLSASEQQTLITTLGATPADVSRRAEVLRAVAEDAGLRSAEFNKAFVLMQYFGYMRRNPNEFPDSNFSGFDFWLQKLNDFNGNFIQAEMVKAFITSLEYRQRFGP